MFLFCQSRISINLLQSSVILIHNLLKKAVVPISRDSRMIDMEIIVTQKKPILMRPIYAYIFLMSYQNRLLHIYMYDVMSLKLYAHT